MNLDVHRVDQIIRDIAAEEILPRFRCLNEGDIKEKQPGDLVTIADIRAEQALTKALRDLIPGSRVVGEEAVAKDYSILGELLSDQPVWIIDPVDGTHNFANNNPRFATIVALVKRGKIINGWIHDPLNDRTAIAEAGAGSFIGSTRLKVAQSTDLNQMIFSVHHGLQKKLLKLAENDHSRFRPIFHKRFGSVAHDYLALAQGETQIGQYMRLMPWDHAAGVLIHREAGGYSAMTSNASPYHPYSYQNDGLLLTPSVDCWQQARELINPGYANVED